MKTSSKPVLALADVTPLVGIAVRWVAVASVALVCAAFSDPSSSIGGAKPGHSVVIDNFESYTNDLHVAKAWYKPPHGAPLVQTLDSMNKGGGNHSLKISYRTTGQAESHYAPFCRVAHWDLSGCNAVRFWLKPDGSGRQLTIELNIANKSGKNIHDLWGMKYLPAKGDTSPRLVTVPFAQLVHNTKYADSPDTSPVFKPGSVIEVAFYIGGRNDEPGDGAYCFDEIMGVNDPALPRP